MSAHHSAQFFTDKTNIKLLKEYTKSHPSFLASLFKVSPEVFLIRQATNTKANVTYVTIRRSGIPTPTPIVTAGQSIQWIKNGMIIDIDLG